MTKITSKFWQQYKGRKNMKNSHNLIKKAKYIFGITIAISLGIGSVVLSQNSGFMNTGTNNGNQSQYTGSYHDGDNVNVNDNRRYNSTYNHRENNLSNEYNDNRRYNEQNTTEYNMNGGTNMINNGDYNRQINN